IKRKNNLKSNISIDKEFLISVLNNDTERFMILLKYGIEKRLQYKNTLSQYKNIFLNSLDKEELIKIINYFDDKNSFLNENKLENESQITKLENENKSLIRCLYRMDKKYNILLKENKSLIKKLAFSTLNYNLSIKETN